MAEVNTGRNIIQFGVRDPSEYDVTGERLLLDPLPLRAVATGAILFFSNNEPIKQLCRMLPELQSKHRQQLAEWWGIETSADARARLDALVRTGHRATLQPQLVQNEAQWRAQFDGYTFLRGRPVTSVAAWDYCRIVNLAYWCRGVGLLTDMPTYEYIHLGAQLAAERFQSWEELAVSFLAGRIMWSPDQSNHERLGSIADYLLTAEHNVWMECPWQGYRRWW